MLSASPNPHSQPVTLDNCDREPIHIPGAIQPHGMLAAYRIDTGLLTHVSDNSQAVVGKSPRELIGQPVSSLFVHPEQSEKELRDITDAKPVYLFTVNLSGTATRYDAIAHRIGDVVCLEFEQGNVGGELSAPELYRLVQRSIVRLQRTESVRDLSRLCADEVKRISGFDRVMVYRFDSEWNGEVVAEAKREDLEPFLGLHYPAADIPRQARELYTKNWLRFIPDAAYLPSRILADSAASDVPLDLSFSVLRSVSPIHIEYLRNMGVRASMSISLLKDGQLWGLIACHHYAGPRFVPYDVRTTCELLGQFMSLHITAAEGRELAGERLRMMQIRSAMLANLERFEDNSKALIESTPQLLDLIPADGASVVDGEHISRIGQTPGEEEIRLLVAWLAENIREDVFSTDRLHEVYGSRVLGSVAAGVLALSVIGARRQYLLWFRTEKIRTVNWAGDPAKSVSKGDGEARLSPRGSFALWKETVRGRSMRWRSFELDIARGLHDGVMHLLARRAEELATAHADLRLASLEREKVLESERAARNEAERLNRMKDDFVATLSHELRTPLNAILGWAQILSRTPDLDSDVMEGVEVIERNARSQAQMIEDLLDISRIIAGKLRLDLQHTHLPSVVDASVETVALAAAAKNIRIEKMIDPLIGIETTADPSRLQQVFGNLLSNAVKFTPKGGKVQVILERVASHVELTVNDTGQGIKPAFLPYVFDRFRQADSSMSRNHGGLGLGLSIVRNLVEMHGGTIRAHSEGEGKGASFVVSLPVRVVPRIENAELKQTLTRYQAGERQSLNLKGVRVLAVDDEPDARVLIQRILEECDCVVEKAASAEEALAALERQSFDVMISDIGMPGRDGYVLIRAWRTREAQLGRTKMPVIALTAYMRSEDRQRSLLAGFQAHLGKPVESGELLALVASLTGRV